MRVPAPRGQPTRGGLRRFVRGLFTRSATTAADDAILSWEHLFPRGYRGPVSAERWAKAGQSTVALLVLDDAVRGFFESNKHGHAEHRLLQSSNWVHTLADAVQNAQGSTVTIVINRTPCHGQVEGCCGKLVSALQHFHTRSPVARGRVRFVIACTGVYETSGPLENRNDFGPTTAHDLRRLEAAGWQIRALRIGGNMTARGQLLANFLPRMRGR